MESSFEIESFLNPSLFRATRMSSTSTKNLSQPIIINESTNGFAQIGGANLTGTPLQFGCSGPFSVMPSQFTDMTNTFFQSQSISSNDHTNVLLIKYLLDPVISRGKKNTRIRYRPTEFKALNAMYQLNKNVIRGDWQKFACGKKKIGKAARKISTKSVTKFICGEGLIFFKKAKRFKATNIYELHEWVVQVFRFFEKKGMMKGIMDDFDNWRDVFLRRLNNWLLPLLEKGLTLKDVLMNKLCTKPKLKGADPIPLKGAGIKPSGFYEAFQGIINGTLSVPSFRLKEIETMFLNGLRKSCEDIGWFSRKGNYIRNPVGLLAERFADHLRPRKV